MAARWRLWCHRHRDATVTPLCPQVPRGLRGAVVPALCRALRAGDRGTLPGDLLRLRLPRPLQHLRPRFWALPGKEGRCQGGGGTWCGVTTLPCHTCPPQNCQHNTEGPQCEKCKPGFFGDATKGTATACHPCPCPYTEPSRRWVPTPGDPPTVRCPRPGVTVTVTRRFSESCFLDTDGQATCDACAPGYAGRRCERWVGVPMVDGGGPYNPPTRHPPTHHPPSP